MDQEREVFIQKCREAIQSFDEWTCAMNEKKLRVNFRRLALIREYLNAVMDEVESVK